VKYRNADTRNRLPGRRAYARQSCSPASLVMPYGEIGCTGSVSRLAAVACPYTLDEEAYTNRGTPACTQAAASRSVARMLLLT
jgi:hypothetical protein